MPLTAPSGLKINQIYALNNGEQSNSVKFPNSWLAMEWANAETADHTVVLETSHQTSLSVATNGFLYANNPTARTLQAFNFPSGTTRAMIPFQVSSVSYGIYSGVGYLNAEAVIVRAYVSTSTESSSVVSMTVPVHPTLLSITTSFFFPTVTAFDYWKLQGPYATAGSYAAVTAYMPGYPEKLTATATQLSNSSVSVSFPFRASFMHPTSAPGILLPITDENHDLNHPLSLPKVYQVKVSNLTGSEIHSGYAFPNVRTGRVEYSIPASTITQTGMYVILAAGLVQTVQQAYTPSSVTLSFNITTNSQTPGGGDQDMYLSGNRVYANFLKTYTNFTGTQINSIQGDITATIVATAPTAQLMGTASGVSVPAYRVNSGLSGYFNTEQQVWSTVMTLTAPAVTSGEGGGGGNTNMFSWLNNDYWYLTDLQVNLATRAATHRHSTVEIKPNDTINFAVLFHNGSAGGIS